MIEEAFLPGRSARGCFAGSFRDRLFQGADPLPEHKLRSATDEEMDVIGHYNVAADGDVEFVRGGIGEPHKGVVHWIAREPFSPVVGSEGDEVRGRCVMLEHVLQTWGPAREFQFSHIPVEGVSEVFARTCGAGIR
ncbi:hypothetical protein BH18VER1_BH18VER1_19940 [soil metagenome]